MFLTLSGISSFSSLSQLLNADIGMSVRPAESFADFSASQPMKLSEPMLLTVSGISIPPSAMHSANAREPILETPSGSLISLRFEHIAKVWLPSSLTPVPSVTFSSAVQERNAAEPTSVT